MVLDPVQANLIAAHVTFAREDELAGIEWSHLQKRFDLLFNEELSLTFGGPEPFDGHGVLLPCIAGEEEFFALRARVLGSCVLRRQRPHITLAHPRNPRAPGNEPAIHARVPQHTVVRFASVSRIKQEPAAPWQVLSHHPLHGLPRRDA